MTFLSLLAVGFLMKIVAAIWVLAGISLVLVVLIQKGKGGGLSGAFGGGMASNILGTKTGDFLTWFTIVLVGVFLLLGVLMVKYYKPTVSDFGTETPVQTQMPAEQPQMPAQTQVPTEQPQLPADIEQPVIPSENAGTENVADTNSKSD